MEFTRAAKYKRISADREGRELGVGRQDEDLDALADRLGLVVVADYTDNDISASTRSSKPRPDYDRMVAAAKAGMFDVILAYTTGRLTRRPREHVDLIELAERHGIRFEYVRSPSFDLTTAQGRRIARTLAAHDAGEAEELGERVQRAVRQRAESGGFHGGQTPFGYVKTGPGECEIHEEQAGWIREAVRRLLNGETIYGICVDWNRQGRTTGNGSRGLWYAQSLHRIIVGPSIAGLRDYEGTLYPGPWPAIVDRDDWERVRTILSDPARAPKRGAPTKHMLSSLVRCALCEYRLIAAKDGDVRSFECVKARGGCGRVSIDMSAVEQYVTALFFASLDERRMAARSTPPRDDREAELWAAIDRDRTALDSLTDEKDDGLIAEGEYRRRRARITSRLEKAEADLAAVTRSQARMALPTANVLKKRWPEMDALQRRAALASVIDRVVIGPHPRGVATSLLRRKGENDTSFERRREEHVADVMQARVSTLWLE